MAERWPQQPLKYVLEETSFHEHSWGNIVIQDSMGPLNPAASFVLYGNLSLEDNKLLHISVSANNVKFPQTAGLVSLRWNVQATLKKNGQEIVTKSIVQQYQSYLTPPGTTVVGEASFDLPEFTDRNVVELYLKGIYIADFGPHGSFVQPRNPPIFGQPAFLKKTFHLRVEYE